jgi:hypothetical protein
MARLGFAGTDLRSQGLAKQRMVVPAAPPRSGSPLLPARAWRGAPGVEPGRPSPPARCRPILPDRAAFDAPGTARIDGLIALGLLLTLVSSLWLLVARTLRASHERTVLLKQLASNSGAP